MGKPSRFTQNRTHRHTDFDAAVPSLPEEDLYERVAATKDALLLILDCVQDPHNLGACLRSADAAGALAVIVPTDKSVGVTGVVRQVACGGAEHTPVVRVTNLSRAMARLKELGVWLVGTADETKDDLFAAKLTGPLGIVMGAEGSGLRRLTRDHCDLLVRIPMAPDAKVDCLNVSVATGVTLFEVVRQRKMRR